MPSRRVSLIGAVVVAGLAATICCPAVATASADDVTVVVGVHQASGRTSSEQVTVSQLESQGCPLAPSTNTPPQYEAPGQLSPASSPTAEAWTVGTLLSGPSTCLPTPIPLRSITGVFLGGGSHGPEELSPGDISSPSDFPDREQPFFWSDGQGEPLQYERPPRNGADANARDAITIDGGATWSIDVYTTPLLAVTARASRSSVPVNQPVSFSAVVKNAVGPVSYSWSFGGATAGGAESSTQAHPSVRFLYSGVYQVGVEAQDAASAGLAYVSVTVGHPRRTTKPGASSGAAGKGRHSGARPAPSAGGESSGASSAPDASGSSVGSTRGSSAGQSGGAGQSGARSLSAPGQASLGRLRTSPAVPDRTPIPASAQPGVEVAGLLLSAPLRPLDGQTADRLGAATSAAGRLHEAADIGGSGWVGAGAGVAAFLLLALGAGREFRAIRSGP